VEHPTKPISMTSWQPWVFPRRWVRLARRRGRHWFILHVGICRIALPLGIGRVLLKHWADGSILHRGSVGTISAELFATLVTFVPGMGYLVGRILWNAVGETPRTRASGDVPEDPPAS